MLISECARVERDVGYPLYPQKERKNLRMTKMWFASMLHQVQTARHDIASQNRSYGIQPNGKLFPAFDIHRHGLAAAYLLNRKSKGEMLSKVENGLSCTKTDALEENLKRITDGVSDIKIVNKEFWRPIPNHQRLKKYENEDLVVDCSKKTASPTDSMTSKKCETSEELPDKIEEQRATAEMELTAKSCIESCAEFKLLFIPGYEIEQPEFFYEDPFKVDPHSEQSRRTSCAQPFSSRILALRKLEDETTASEDKQKRLENFLCPSRYNGAYRERKHSVERRSNTARLSGIAPERTSATLKSKITPQTPSRRNRVTAGKKGFSCVEGIFDTAKSSHKKVVSEYKALTYLCNQASSEDTDSLQSIEPKESSTRVTRRRRNKSSPSPNLTPTKFYDVTEIAAAYNVPCSEKMKETPKKKRQNSSPGKSFFSQRKNSLTKAVTRRPATAEFRKKKAFSPKRPNTAAVVTRKE